MGLTGAGAESLGLADHPVLGVAAAGAHEQAGEQETSCPAHRPDSEFHEVLLMMMDAKQNAASDDGGCGAGRDSIDYGLFSGGERFGSLAEAGSSPSEDAG